MNRKQLAALWGLGGLLGGFGVGLGVRAYAQAAPPSPGREGRFQMYFSPLARADTYIMDTQSGDCWTFVVTKDGVLEKVHVPSDPNTIATRPIP